MTSLATVEIVASFPVQKIIDDLLLFDARCLPKETSRELMGMLPHLALVRRAWRNLYRKYGCNGCPKPDPTIAICARLRRQGLSWARIYDAIGADYARSTLADRKYFKAAVKRKMADLDSGRLQLYSYRARGRDFHAAGGLCDTCRGRNRRRLLKELAQICSQPEEKEKAIRGLSQRFDVAQWLLNSDE